MIKYYSQPIHLSGTIEKKKIKHEYLKEQGDYHLERKTVENQRKNEMNDKKEIKETNQANQEKKSQMK
jgi:hypothetical protein